MYSIIRYAVLNVAKTRRKKTVLVTLGDFVSDLVLHRVQTRRPFDNTLGIV